MVVLRPYQEKAIDLIRNAYLSHSKILVQSPTGSGKTEIIFHLIAEHLSNHLKCLFVVRRRQIVFQTVRRLMDTGFSDVGVIMAGNSTNTSAPVLVCSIDTIHSRVSSLGYIKKCDAVFVDEAHDATSDSYKQLFQFLGNKKYFGFTATPYRIGKKTHEWWDRCIVVTTTAQLIKEGYLCPAKLYVPCSIDTSNVKIESTGDYNLKQLYEVASSKKVMGRIVKEYQDKASNAPAVCFAVNKKHSKQIAESFNEAGIEAMHVEDTTDQATRDKALLKVQESFYSGIPFVLCNVNIFSTGVDLPQLTCGIMARPTESRVLWVQQLGRLLRICRGKHKAIIIDHAANSLRFGTVTNYHPPEMSPVKVSDKPKPVTVCPKCFYFHDKIVSVCESCGAHIKSYRLSLTAGQERKIDTDENFSMKSYEEMIDDEMRQYVKKNVRYALEVLKRSEKEAWEPVYNKYTELFLQKWEALGCPDYVARGFRKKHLTKSVEDVRVIYA